jgi:hypothetical protein
VLSQLPQVSQQPSSCLPSLLPSRLFLSFPFHLSCQCVSIYQLSSLLPSPSVSFYTSPSFSHTFVFLFCLLSSLSRVNACFLLSFTTFSCAVVPLSVTLFFFPALVCLSISYLYHLVPLSSSITGFSYVLSLHVSV